jgi:hypothetical protein
VPIPASRRPRAPFYLSSWALNHHVAAPQTGSIGAPSPNIVSEQNFGNKLCGDRCAFRVVLFGSSHLRFFHGLNRTVLLVFNFLCSRIQSHLLYPRRPLFALLIRACTWLRRRTISPLSSLCNRYPQASVGFTYTYGTAIYNGVTWGTKLVIDVCSVCGSQAFARFSL